MRIIGPSLMEWPSRVRTLFPVALAGLGATTVVGPPLLGWSALRLARSVSAAESDRARASNVGAGIGASVAIAGVAGVAVAGLVAGTVVARRRFLTNTANAARDLDPGFREPPVSPLVSTGPGSLVDPRGVGREGARYVGTATTGDDVRFVTGAEPLADPIRVFVGWDAGASVQQRVDLAMAELRRTGAFDRSHLVIQAPAGTGYANATPVDVVELLSRGDCASVAVGYGLLPSFLSLNRVDLARRTQLALLEAIAAECDSRGGRSAGSAGSGRPRLLLYGESLGAKVQQAALATGIADLDRFGIDAALWVGTPGGVDYDDVHRAFDPVAVTLDRPEQIDQVLRAHPTPRVWFLEHDGDPVVRFRSDLAHTRPTWLSPAQGRGVPPDMQWRIGVTWAQVLVDTLYATDMSPGDFRSHGHDYRADLGAVVTEAFGLAPVDAQDGWAERREFRLRELEVRRAEQVRGSLASQRPRAPEATSP